MAEDTAYAADADLIDRGTLVKAFWDAVDRGAPRLQSIPGLIKKILQTDAWRCRTHNGQVYEHEHFLDFLTAKPAAGCGYDPAQIEKLIGDDDEALTLYRKAASARRAQEIDQRDRDRKSVQPVGAPMGNKNASVEKQSCITHSDVIQDCFYPTGTSSARALRALRAHHPEIHARVLAGEMTPNAGMVAAGRRKPQMRPPKSPFEALAEKIKTRGHLLTSEECCQLIKMLKSAI